MTSPPEPQAGWCSPEIEAELPGLRLLEVELELAPGVQFSGDSPPGIVERLHEHSSRLRGPRAIGMRTEPVPSAYRVFYRQIGLDPDVQRTHLEHAVFERIMHGGFATSGLLGDVLLIALIDTGVPVWALDGRTLDGRLGIRTSGAGETLGRRPGDAEALAAGRLVVADAGGALAVLFGDPAGGHSPGPGTSSLRLFALQVTGVPSLYVEEALWSCASSLLAL
jgi:DNA/RNA-binding domain of Phe-tRNA-synthetase-like protein